MDKPYRKTYRELRKVLAQGRSEPEPALQGGWRRHFIQAVWTILALSTLMLVFRGCSPVLGAVLPVVEYSNNQYVNAIFWAEGGYNAVYLYGIRNIHYKNKEEAKR